MTAPETPAKVGALARTQAFLADVRTEMDKVTWPPKDQLILATRQIVIFAVVLGVAIGLLDFLLQKILVDGVAALAR
jgi:preprotein translocase SecE subunit